MKRLIAPFTIFFTIFYFSHQAQAQLLRRIKEGVKSEVENQLVNQASEGTDKAIGKAEEAVKNSVTGKSSPRSHNTSIEHEVSENSDSMQNNTAVVATDPASPTIESASIASYRNYDFVPGDKVIFETDFSSQQDAELPARLGTLHGSAEIQTYRDEKVLHVEKGDPVCIIPMIDSANYLADPFTVEFDFLYNDPDPTSFNQIEVNFYKSDKDNEYMKDNNGDYHMLIYEADQLDFGPSINGKTLPNHVVSMLKTPNTWHHIAIYVHHHVGKAYIDQYRVAASNMMPIGMTKLALKTNGRMDYMIKNLRMAGGGSDAYQKIVTEGKLVTHGIHFSSGKSDILPESMGTINEVYQILKNHPNLHLEIDGYTDNDGSTDLNLKLSGERADAVKDQLVHMGIDMSHLTAKGLGESNPIDSNNTPQGKANNRRVEFMKK